jgi:methionyl-tRNA formyltransferase
MLLKRTTSITPEDDAASLHDRLAALGAETMAATLDLLLAGELRPEKQDDSLSCYAPMLKKELGGINWNSPTEKIVNLVRGVIPWPGAYTMLEGKVVKIHKVLAASGSGTPGEVLKTGKAGIETATQDGSIIIEELQLEGKKRLKAAEFLAGCRVEPGSFFENP